MVLHFLTISPEHILFVRLKAGASEMAQPGDLTFIPGTHVNMRELTPLNCLLALTHALAWTLVHTHYTH